MPVAMNSKCEICRRQGVKLFLKGERCLSPKCAMVERPFAPGKTGKRPRRGLSEYGKELREKQKLQNWYNLRERQFKKYVKETLAQKSRAQDAADFLIKKLERRLDNVIYRLGFAVSRVQAREMVSHGHFMINGKKVTIPSYLVKRGDKITIRPGSQVKTFFQNLKPQIKKYTPPSWLSLNNEKLEGQITGLPTLEEAAPPAEISTIFEFYSR